MKLSWDSYFLGIAEAVSKRASCPRFSVGAVLVDEGHHIYSTGYNGAGSGAPECTDIGCDIVNDHCQRAVHAEMNCIYAAEGHSVRPGSTLYLTLEPCSVCVEAMNRQYENQLSLYNKIGFNLKPLRIIWKTSQAEYRAMRDTMSGMPKGPETI